MVEGEQDVLGEYVDSILTAVIEIAAEQEQRHPADVLDKIDLHVNYTVPVVQQKLEEARATGARLAKIKSPQTIAAEEGLDYDKEQANFAQARRSRRYRNPDIGSRQAAAGEPWASELGARVKLPRGVDPPESKAGGRIKNVKILGATSRNRRQHTARRCVRP